MIDPEPRRVENLAPTKLSQATRIGLIGDLHGDVGALLTIAQAMHERDVDVLLTLGDFGLLWPGGNWSNQVVKVSKRLGARNQVLYFVDGNHEDHKVLASFPVGKNGTREIRENLIHLPRGYRTTLTSGRTLAALGGANSIDLDHRVEGRTWWPEEAITEADLEALGTDHADILVGHDAPLDVLSLDQALTRSDPIWPPLALAYAQEGRRMFHRGFLQASPNLYLGGHYHRPIDETVGYFDGSHGFPARVVLLDMVQNEGASCAILTIDTLGLELFTSRGRPVPASPAQVTQLTMETGGRWMLHTLGSRHLLDLDHLTVERIPRPDSARSTSDGLHYLRTLDEVRLGRPGRWTMQGDYLIDHYWHVSSIIRHLERLPEARRP
jgi:predicted phosphodiesterase